MNNVMIGAVSGLSALEKRKYAGLIMNKIQSEYNVKTGSTSTGETIWVKPADYDKLKNDFKLVKLGGQYVIMVNQSLVKKIFNK